MNSLGPYNINPFLLRYPSQPIPIQVGANGLVEVINLTNFNMNIQLQSAGVVFQEQRSKCCYRIVSAQGTQMCTLIPQIPGPFADIPNRYVRLPPALENGEIGFLGVWVNVYQEGEIEWYPPVALSPPPSQACFYASTSGSTISLSLPTTETFFTNQTPGSGVCNLLGFDLTSSPPTATAHGTLVISNVNNQPDGSTSITYGLAAPSTNGFGPLIVRFPTPIPNLLGQQITFTAASISGATMYLTAYYSLT